MVIRLSTTLSCLCLCCTLVSFNLFAESNLQEHQKHMNTLCYYMLSLQVWERGFRLHAAGLKLVVECRVLTGLLMPVIYYSAGIKWSFRSKKVKQCLYSNFVNSILLFLLSAWGIVSRHCLAFNSISVCPESIVRVCPIRANKEKAISCSFESVLTDV